MYAEIGLPGDEFKLELRLRLMADVALVGMPNAGKSSLLRRLSNARPKVGSYPFTTIEPVLGTVERPDGGQLVVIDGRRFESALENLPGLARNLLATLSTRLRETNKALDL